MIKNTFKMINIKFKSGGLILSFKNDLFLIQSLDILSYLILSLLFLFCVSCSKMTSNIIFVTIHATHHDV